MKKRLVCLFMALIMLLSLALTSCSAKKEDENGTSENNEEDVGARSNLILTLYGVTADSSTDEGIAATEKLLSEYCIAKYKTGIDLRLSKESAYNSSIADMEKKFAEKDAEILAAEEEAKKAAAEEKELLKGMSAEEKRDYAQKKRLEEKAAKDKAEKEAAEKAELIEKGEDIAKVDEVQMDIVYIPDVETYEEMVAEGKLVDINPYLTGKFKDVTNFVYPTYIFGAQKGTSVYGIPMNKAVEGKETYFIVNKSLASKYGVDFSKVRSVTDLEPYFAMAKAEGVSPIYGDFDPENVYFLDIVPGVESRGMASCFFTDTLPQAQFTPTMLNRTFNHTGSYGTQFIDFCALKANYRAAGYLSDSSNNFFIGIQELDKTERDAWEKKGYEIITYRGAEFNNENVMDCGLFGISSRCTNPDRAMEILKLIYTDEGFHNIFTYGVEGTNYIANADKTVTIVDNSYSMDPFKTGNALIGLVTKEMGADYISYAIQKNLNSRVSPLLGFIFDDGSEDAEKAIAAYKHWNDKFKDQVAKLLAGTPDYLKILEQINTALSNDPEYTYEDAINASARKNAMVDHLAEVKAFCDSKLS